MMSCHLQLIHRVPSLRTFHLVVRWGVPQVQRPSPHSHLHVPRTPAVLPILVWRGRLELMVSELPGRCVQTKYFSNPNAPLHWRSQPVIMRLDSCNVRVQCIDKVRFLIPNSTRKEVDLGCMPSHTQGGASPSPRPTIVTGQQHIGLTLGSAGGSSGSHWCSCRTGSVFGASSGPQRWSPC